MSTTAYDDEQGGPEAWPGPATPVVARLRATARSIARLQARQLREIAELAALVERAVLPELAGRGVSSGSGSASADAALVETAVLREVQVALGISARAAGAELDLAQRLVTTLPETLAALETGRLDIARARAVAQRTEVLEPAQARWVQQQVLPAAGDGPWDGPSPRAWRDRLARAVVRADPDAARRRRERAIEARSAHTWFTGSGTGVLRVEAADHDVALVEAVVDALARASHADDRREGRARGRTLRQCRADVVVDLFRRAARGDDPPAAAVGRRELGLVLHVDTLLADGPAADDPAQLRGAGPVSPVDPESARLAAFEILHDRAHAVVLLTDSSGVLRRTVRVRLPCGCGGPAGPHCGGGCWDRADLVAAVHSALPVGALEALAAGGGAPVLRAAGYAPSTPIVDVVRATYPTCTGYDCPRAVDRCDLDHDVPWPRGPTDPGNLAPRCRRDHELKTRGLHHTRRGPDGAISTVTVTGQTFTTRPTPLPGHGAGEGYAGAPGPRLGDAA